MIEVQEVDLLLVQESYPHDVHLPPLLYPHLPSGLSGKWSSEWVGGVQSTRLGVRRPETDFFVPGFIGWVVGAEIHDATWQPNQTDPLMVFSIHAPSRSESYYAKQVNKLLDEIARIANGREIILGGDFNLTIGHSVASERPVSKQDMAIQNDWLEEFGLINCWQFTNPDKPYCRRLFDGQRN
ncbi:MAG: hypothetical protein U0892_13860 [Pirellulales bacterium]